MKWLSLSSITSLVALLQPGLVHSQSSEAVRVQHVEGRLVSEVSRVQTGTAFRVGLLLKHDAHWHTYWKSSATGYATSIEWDLPEGWSASDLSWPTPERYESMGFIEYVYGDEVLLMATITPPQSHGQDEVEISFTADWLMCADLCIPGSMNSDPALIYYVVVTIMINIVMNNINYKILIIYLLY